MKSILLATASILAFAGAAAAEVTFGGDAELGYNLDDEDENDNGIRDDSPFETEDHDGFDGENGFFWEANLGVTMTQELNNGLTAAASFGLNITEDDVGDDNVSIDDDFLLSLTTEQGGVFFGDTAFAAESHWDGTGEMLSDEFSEQDEEIVLRGDWNFSGIEASVSGLVADVDGNTPEDDLDQLSFGAEATFGAFNVTTAYQEESEVVEDGVVLGGYDPFTNDDFEPWEVFGISAGTTFGGADVQVAYATNMSLEDDSLGFEVSYPFGPVTLGAYYVIENDDDSDIFGDDGDDDLDDSFGVSADYASGPLTVSAFYEFEDDQEDDDGDFEDDDISDDDDFGVEVGYDTGTGIEVFAGWIDSTEGYAGVEYDLGNGAELIASWAEQDEEGAKEYEEGTTVSVQFEF